MSAFRRRLMMMQGKASGMDELGYVEGKSFFLDCIQEGKPDGLEDAQIHADGAKTIELVARLRSGNNYGKIFEKGNFGYLWSNRIECYYGGYFSAYYNSPIDATALHTFTFIQNGSFSMYLDGKRQAEVNFSNGKGTFDIEPQRYYANVKFLLYSFRVYPQVLSQQEITSNYNTDKKRFDL